MAAVGVPAVASVLWLPSLGAAIPARIRNAIELAHPGVDWVSQADMVRWMRRDNPPVILDVREPGEFRVSQIAGARRVSPDLREFDSLNLQPNQCVVVYCSVGWRSGILAERMEAAGFTRVFNLDGGLFGWANAGRPMVQDGRPATRVHPFDATWGRLLDDDRRAPLPGAAE